MGVGPEYQKGLGAQTVAARGERPWTGHCALRASVSPQIEWEDSDISE